MEFQPLNIYNTLSRQKERFEPLNPPFVGLYVCGPTVYSDVHLGNCRTFISFDLIYRYLLHLGYKVRYVRNITDAGHLEGDRDEGDDKFAKKARLEQLEPMEIVQRYTLGFHDVMRAFNTLPPSIEPTATGHIIEQIEMIKQIISNGYAYEVNGTVYFDVEKYSKEFNYGQLTNRLLEDMIANTRELGGQDEKKGRLDFALWINAKPEHIMRWPSPWGVGFPGWHIECSAMSGKYLGETFDIHGGGMDLLFPHHECEIAQSVGATGKDPVRYWMHNNMITINGQKMGKSLGNFINLSELYAGSHKLLEQPYSPMTIRFFILQAHYRSPLDFSNEGLKAAEKGMKKLLNAKSLLPKLKAGASTTSDIQSVIDSSYAAMNDDLNTAIAIASLFEAVRIINSVYAGTETISASDLEKLTNFFNLFVSDVLGLKEEAAGDDGTVDGLMNLILELRKDVKAKKDFASSDKIRDMLNALGFKIKDEKDGTTWTRN